MADLAGDFHFAGENEARLARRISAQLNELNGLNRQLPELNWMAYQNHDGSHAVGARVDRIRTIHVAGDWLENNGIITDYQMIEFRPSEEEELMGKDRYWVIALAVFDIDENKLQQISDRQASKTTLSLFPQNRPLFN